MQQSACRDLEAVSRTHWRPRLSQRHQAAHRRVARPLGNYNDADHGAASSKYLRSMFAAAVAEDQRPDNPATDVRARGKIKSKQEPGRPFTGDQIRLIWTKQPKYELGKRHGEVLWMLKLMLWTGARPETDLPTAQSRCLCRGQCALIHIRARHSEQTLKTGRARRIPLHPAIATDFVAYADASERDFIFGAFGFVSQTVVAPTGWCSIFRNSSRRLWHQDPSRRGKAHAVQLPACVPRRGAER